MANYLITGGAGFIGSHLAKNLIADRHQVRVIDDLSTGEADRLPALCQLIVGDVRDQRAVAEAMQGMDGCFHLAAVASVQRSNDAWLQSHQINLSGTINVFDAARENSTPVVYASSAAVYGDNAEIPLKESSLVRPLTAYGADKLGSELHARIAGLVHGVPTKGLRFFNVFGPKQDPASPYSGVISIFVDRLLKGESVTIYGDGEQRRDFVYVADVVAALRGAMAHTDCNGSALNVCTGESVTIQQLATIIMSILDVRLPMLYRPSRKGDIRMSIGDPFKAQTELGFKASRSLVEGLRELIVYEQEKIILQQPLKAVAY